MKPKFMWAGIVDDEVDIRNVDTGWGGWGVGKDKMPALFTSRQKARRQYQKVIGVWIEESHHMSEKS